MTDNALPTKLIMVDVDGTLTKGETTYWEEGDECKPDLDAINWVNEAYTNGAHIVIHTARPWMHAQETVAWLDKHGVRYHGIRMNKGGADMYVDDKSIRPDERRRAFFKEDGDIEVNGPNDE